jgi:hypothetical protein
MLAQHVGGVIICTAAHDAAAQLEPRLPTQQAAVTAINTKLCSKTAAAATNHLAAAKHKWQYVTTHTGSYQTYGTPAQGLPSLW